LALHAIHWILLAPLFRSREEPESVLRSSPISKSVGGRWDRYEEAPSVMKRGLGGGWTVSCLLHVLTQDGLTLQTLIITVLLVLLASANSVHLFTKYRTYSMQTRSVSHRAQILLRATHDRPKNRSAHPMRRPFPLPSDSPARMSSAARLHSQPRTSLATRRSCD